MANEACSPMIGKPVSTTPLASRFTSTAAASFHVDLRTFQARDIDPGTVRTSDKWEVTAAPAEHVQPYLDSLAYRLDSVGGKSVVFTGDTQPCQSVVELARGADLDGMYVLG